MITRLSSRVFIIILAVLVMAAGVYIYLRLPSPSTRKTHRVDVTQPHLKPTSFIVGKVMPHTVTPAPKKSAQQGPATSGNGSSSTGPSLPAGGGSPCPSASSPYGFTVVNVDQTLLSIYSQMNVCWARFQIHVSSIQSGSGSYNWSELDSVVAMLNAAHIHIDIPIQCFAPSGGGSDQCFTNPVEPTPQQMAAFATQIATRYNGKNGHGFIDAYEIGNEEYEFYPDSTYGPILQAGYQAIKAASPQALVGMYGPFISSLSRTTATFTTIFSGGYGKYMDFMNFHYYNEGQDPSTTVGDRPSFDLKWQTIHNIAAQYGYGNLPIWVTETGWTTTPLPGRATVTPQQQAQYLQYVTNEAAHSGVVQKIFWYTVDDGNQGNTIYPPSGPLPAFNALQAYVQQNPAW
jgi:hypothetical protein